MSNAAIVLNEILVDLGSKSAKSNVGKWEIQVEEPKRNKFFSRFSLDIQKKVRLYLDKLKANDFKIGDEGKLLSISLNNEEWGYGEKKEILLNSLYTFFHVVINPLAISDCRHKQSEGGMNIYPISFSIVLEDCETNGVIACIPVCFNVKLAKKANKPSVTIELDSSEQVFSSGLKDETIGVVKISNPATLNYCPNISGKLHLQVLDKENGQIDGNIYLDINNEEGYIDFGSLESGKEVKYDIKANYPGIGNPLAMETVYEIIAVCSDLNGNEIGKDAKGFTVKRNETRPQMLVALKCSGREDVYVNDGEEVHDAFRLIFSNEQALNMPCFSFNIWNGSKNGLEGMGVVVRNIQCIPKLSPQGSALFRNGKKIDDVFALHCSAGELLQSGERKSYSVSFCQNDIVEMYTLNNGNDKDFNTEIAFKISFAYWDCAEILDLNNLPGDLKKEFCFTVVKRLHQRPSSQWLAIDYGTSAIVARFANSMLKLRDKKLKLFRVKTDSYEVDTQYLSSSVIYRNNRATLDDQSSLICDYIDENELPDYNSLAITLSPTKDVEDQNINFILPCMKMLMGYDYIPNITQYSGYTYSYRSDGQIIEQPLYSKSKDEEGQIIPSELCKISNIMYEVYKELFLYFIKGEIGNPRMLNNIVLTVPNTFSPNHFLQLRGIIDESFKEYNIRNLNFISESDAVACYYFRNWADINRNVERTNENLQSLRKEERVLVYDMGAGTLDLTYLIRKGAEIEVKGRMGIAKAGNYLDGLLAKIISDKAGSLNNLKRISDPSEITTADRLVAARKLKEVIRNKFKPILYKGDESLILSREDFANIGIRQDIAIPVSEITGDQTFIDYIESCTSGTLNNFFDFYGIRSEETGNLRVDTIIISGRASKLSFIQEQLQEYFQSLMEGNPNFKLIDMSTIMNDDKSKDVVVEGAMAYAQQNNLKIKYNNIMANYGILYYDNMGDLKYAEILNPRTTKPTASRVMEGMVVNQYVTEEVVCDISGCIGNDRPLTLLQSYSQNTLDDWEKGNHEYITVMSQWRDLGGATASRIKIEVDGDNRMRLFIDGAFTDGLAPSYIDVNSELNKRSMWPILYR